MPFIILSGLPPEDTYPKQVRFLRLYIHRAGITAFWINDIFSTHGSESKEAKVELTLEKDIFLLEEFLRAVPYQRHTIPYYLRLQRQHYGGEDNARGGVKRPSFTENDHPYDRFSPIDESSLERQRSRSPYYNDTSQLDIEIQILQKKRQLIEEQQRLLAEQENLQRMKEYGARPPRRDYGASSSRPERPLEQPRPGKDDRSRALFVPPKRLGGIPLFTFPCKNLMRKIRPIIRKKTNVEHERSLLEKLIRSHLRKEIALVLENIKEYLPAMEIVELYRQQHPATQDEALVLKTLEDVRASFWPVVKNRPAKKKTSKKKKKATGTRTATIDLDREYRVEVVSDTIKNNAEPNTDDTSVINVPTDKENEVEVEKEVDEPTDVDGCQSEAGTESTLDADQNKTTDNQAKATDGLIHVSTNGTDQGLAFDETVDNKSTDVEEVKTTDNVDGVEVIETAGPVITVEDNSTDVEEVKTTDNVDGVEVIETAGPVITVEDNSSDVEEVETTDNVDGAEVIETAGLVKTEDNDGWATNGVEWQDV